jgi:flagellar hook protein FlgE
MGAFDSLSAATSGLLAQSFALQNISGNIANSQTTGFKTVDTSFQDVMEAQMNGVSGDVAGGVRAASDESNTKQGTIQTSSVATNMAIRGDGYFSVESPTTVGANGQPSFAGATQQYTRRGDFKPDGSGRLVNGDGNYLMEAPVDANGNPTGGAPQPLQFDAASLPSGQGALQGISIGTNGTVVGTFASGQQIALASVPLSSFRGEDFLQQNVNGTVSATALSGAALTTASGSVVGGSLESSNTDVLDQLTALIQTQQAYAADTKIITTTDEMLQTWTNMVF